MKKNRYLSIFLFLIFFSAILLAFPRAVSAKTKECYSVTVSPGTVGDNTILIRDGSVYNGEDYRINVDGPGKNGNYNLTANETGVLSISHLFSYAGEYNILVEYEKGSKNICKNTITIQPAASCDWNIVPENPIKDEELTVSVANVAEVIPAGDFQLKVVKVNGNEDRFTKNKNPIVYTPKIAGSYRFRLYSLAGANTLVCEIPVTVGTEAEPGKVGKGTSPGIIKTGTIYDICQENEKCRQCFNNKASEEPYVFENGGAWMAIGCIPTDPTELVKWIFPYLLGFGGLAAFGLIVFSGIKMLTSAGNQEVIQGAKETITSAITGLIFIILSLFLLRLIGVDILGLPGLGSQ